MTENPHVASEAAPIQGAALSHARNFSVGMGAGAGAVTGAVFGAIWGLVGGQGIKIRSAVLAGIGAVVGAGLSHHTWAAPVRLTPTPAATTPEFTIDSASAKPADRLSALPNAEISQAL